MTHQGASILLPARRVDKQLKASIRSCLRQIRFDLLEIIVIIEKSDLSTIQAAQSVRDSRVCILQVPDGSSLSAKLNFGLQAANFPFVARMDADDQCLPWRFSRQLEVLTSVKADVLFSTAIIFGSHLRPFPILPQIPISLGPEDMRQGLVFANPAVHPTMFARKDVLSSVGGYREVPAEDLDLWIRLSLDGKKIVRDWCPAILYRYSRDSMSHSSDFRDSVEESESITQGRKDLAILVLEETRSDIPIDATLNNLRRAINRTTRLKVASWGVGLNQ